MDDAKFILDMVVSGTFSAAALAVLVFTVIQMFKGPPRG